MVHRENKHDAFIKKYSFKELSTSGRSFLESVKVGDVYISRQVIEPGNISGNHYHKETNTIFFIEQGKVRVKFKQVHTGEEKSFVMQPGDGIVHVPTYVAVASKNIGKEEAIVILLSNKAFRSGDDYDMPIIEE